MSNAKKSGRKIQVEAEPDLLLHNNGSKIGGEMHGRCRMMDRGSHIILRPKLPKIRYFS